MSELSKVQCSIHPLARGVSYEQFLIDNVAKLAAEWRVTITPEYLERHAKQKWLQSVATARDRYGWKSL